ncbi:hypothetical protein BH11PLA2_BH11PLA2_32720 [soil metagenome]
MPHMNTVSQIGRLTREVETRAIGNGGLIAKFGLANNERKKDAEGNWVNGKPMFIDVTCFGWLAEHARDNFAKGQEICVAGRLELDQWDDKNGGGKRSKHVIIADTAFAVLWKPKAASGSPSRSEASGDYGSGYGSSGGFFGPAQQEPASSDHSDHNGDIPFAFTLLALASTLSTLV